MKPYKSKYNYVTRFQYNLANTSKRPIEDMVVVSPTVARDIDNMKSRIRELESEVEHLNVQARLFSMGLVK